MSSTLFFISYRVADAAEQAEQMYNLLADRYKPEWVFRDTTSLEPGQLWPEKLKEKVNESEAVLVLVRDTEKWLGVDGSNQRRIDHQNDWVRKEIETALLQKKIVVPVMIDNARVNKDILPRSLEALLERQLVRLSASNLSDRLYEGGLESLMETLDKVVTKYHFSQGELSEAIGMLKKMNIKGSDEGMLAMTAARLASLQKKESKGVISIENANLERAQIKQNILHLMNNYS
jgi:TIR domain/Effector-associated domain 11